MAKQKNLVDQLVSEQNFVWAILFVLTVGGAVLGQIEIGKVQMDTDVLSTSAVVMPHVAGTHTSKIIHNKK